MSLKAKVEAVLFLTEKPMRAQAVARIVNEDVQVVRQAILDLIHDYEERKGGLEISDDDGYIIQVKDEYSSIIDEFLPLEMPVALLRTLSAIALKQPVSQSEIIKIRGAGAYDHIKELVEKELVNKKEDGRSPMLSTTKRFQEYFRLTQDAKSLRHQLRKTDRTKEESQDEAQADGAADASAAVTQLSISESALEKVETMTVPDRVFAPDEPQSDEPSAISEAPGHATEVLDQSESDAEVFDASPPDDAKAADFRGVSRSAGETVV